MTASSQDNTYLGTKTTLVPNGTNRVKLTTVSPLSLTKRKGTLRAQVL